jgi:hypothetical protein
MKQKQSLETQTSKPAPTRIILPDINIHTDTNIDTDTHTDIDLKSHHPPQRRLAAWPMLYNVLQWTLTRMQERSTWMGMIGLLAAMGYRIRPEMEQAITFIGLGITSLIIILTRDDQGKNKHK